MTLSAERSICHNGAEDLDHVLRRFRLARELWEKVLNADALQRFLVSPFDEWLKANLTVKPRTMSFPCVWSMRFSIFCWLLWKTHCCTIFGGDQVTRESGFDRGKRLIEECERVYNPERGKEKPLMAALGHSLTRDGLMFVVPPATVALMVEEEQAHWDGAGDRFQ
ncbi:hypothetical protein V6N13_012978 [Hibiscus sabdariffa]